jgi:predicted dehydrogenase
MLTYALVGDTASDDPLALHLSQIEPLHRAPLPGIDALATTAVDVLICVDPLPISAEQAVLLQQFVERGGRLVCAGPALASWSDRPELLRLLGSPLSAAWPSSELIVRPPTLISVPEHALTRRFERRWAVVERLQPTELPADAMPALEVSWQMRRYPVAWTRSYGRGCVAVTTLGGSRETRRDPRFSELIARAALFTAGVQERAPIRVAMLGYGAIGREHAEAIDAVDGLRLQAVCDRNPERLAQARALHGDITVYDDMAALQRAADVDLVIVSTPPNTHAAVALKLLRDGKHVVVEKPFSITTAEADEMIATAADLKRTLTVYQNRRWDADFLAIKRAVQQGAIGDVFQLETFIGGYGHPCDYWHSDAAISGGVFYDWGSHYLDWILNLLPEPVRAVSAHAHKRVWHDVTNADHSSIRLRFAGGVIAEFTHSDIAAALKPKWYVLGTQGAIVADWRHETVATRRWSGDLIEERLQAAESPSRVTVYQRDLNDAIHAQALELPASPPQPFHRNLADHLLLGLPLAVTPRSSRRNIAVMEAATRSAAQDGAWIEPE